MILLFLLWTSVLGIFLDFEASLSICQVDKLIFLSFPLIPRIPDVENGTHPLSGHTAVTAEQVGSEARQPEEQSDCEG